MAAKPSDDHLKEIKEAFYMFDVNNRGRIDTKQLGTAIRSLGQNPSQSEVEKMMKEADKKGNGYIEEKEFVAVIQKSWKPVNTEEDIIDAFKVFDREGSGYLDAKQLRYVLKNLGEALTDDEITDLMDAANLDADGQLNYTALSHLLLQSTRS